MKLALALAVAALTTLAGCKKDKKDGGDPGAAPVTGSGSADGSSTAGSAVTPPAPPPTTPPPPVVPAAPTLADVTRQASAVLRRVADGVDVATMHGCSEGQDRVAELFETSDEAAAGDLHAWLAADPKLLAEAQALMKDAKDPAIAEPLAKIDAAIKDCKKAVEIVATWKTKLVEPR